MQRPVTVFLRLRTSVFPMTVGDMALTGLLNPKDVYKTLAHPPHEAATGILDFIFPTDTYLLKPSPLDK